MSRLFDFKCDTCERVTERMIDGDEHEIPCDRTACGGTAHRLIGGDPVPRSGTGKARAPTLRERARAAGIPDAAVHVGCAHLPGYRVDVFVDDGHGGLKA